jgi:hypothetical protein
MDVFANCSEEDKIHPLLTAGIAEAQQSNTTLNYLFKRNAAIDNALEVKLIDNTVCVCKDGWLVMPKPLQVHAIMWHNHYLQHPGHTCLEVTMNAVMYWYWKGIPTTGQSITRSCKTSQTRKRWKLRY